MSSFYLELSAISIVTIFCHHHQHLRCLWDLHLKLRHFEFCAKIEHNFLIMHINFFSKNIQWCHNRDIILKFCTQVVETKVNTKYQFFKMNKLCVPKIKFGNKLSHLFLTILLTCNCIDNFSEHQLIN